LRLLPLLAGMLLLSVWSGRLISKLGRYKGFVIAGTTILALGLTWMATIHVTTSAWVLSAMMFVVGTGLGLFMQTLILAVQNAIPYEYLGTGTGAVTFFRTLGGAIGAAVLGAVLLEQEKTTAAHYVHLYGPTLGPLQTFTHAMDTAFLFAVPVAGMAVLLSFLLRDVRLRTVTGGPGAPAAAEPVAAPALE
jgi:MFS family permease